MTTYIEVNPCSEHDYEVTRCETPKAMFFSVYVGPAPDSYDWIADFATQTLAVEFATYLCDKHGYVLCNNT